MSVKVWTNRGQMDPACRIVVSVPAYAEEDSVLECIWSVAQQVGLEKTQYEMGLIVNNSWEEARQKTVAFQNNQRSLRLLKACLAKGRLTVPVRFHPIIKRIRNSGLSLVVVDASSPIHAVRQHSVGRARDTLTKILIQRFKRIGQSQGIILSTDADCTLDGLALSQAVSAFDQHPKLVGAVGTPQGFYPSNVPYSDSIQIYFELRKYLQMVFNDLGVLEMIPTPQLFSQFKLEGFCACFRIDAYEGAGGFAHLLGGEDYVLGFKLAQLGEVMTIPSIAHVPLRVSRRTSKGEGLGWEVERALQAVISREFIFPSVEYYQAYGELLRSIAKGRSWQQFSRTHRQVAKTLNANIYSALLARWRTKSQFLKHPEDYFKLKQFVLQSVVPKLKSTFPDQPAKTVLQTAQDLVFRQWPQPRWRKLYEHILSQPLTDFPPNKQISTELLQSYQQAKALHHTIERIQG